MKRNLAALALVILGVLPATHGQARHWDLNDMTIIYPMPDNSREDQAMVRPDDEGAHGQLLPKDVAAQFARIQEPIDKIYPDIRLISVRLDPCGIQVNGQCDPELRLVWQRLVPGTEGTGMYRATVTQAFHTFYRLTMDEVRVYSIALGKLLKKHSPSTRGKSLNIHPAFARDRIYGPFGQGLRKLIAETVGMRKIFQIAAIGRDQLKPKEPVIAFQSKDWDGKKWSDHPIAGISTNIQAMHLKDETGPYTFAVDLVPEPDNLNSDARSMVKNSEPFFKTATRAQIIRAATHLGVSQNPRLTHRDNVNCATCHMAPNAERWIRVAYPNLNLFNAKYRYRNPKFNLGDNGPLNWGLFALGYQRGTLTTHPRAIAETAESAEWMNKNASLLGLGAGE